MRPPATPPPTPAAAARDRAQLVCAVSADERRLFLHGGDELRRIVSPALEMTWAGDPATVEAALREINPDVLLTAWSTRPLPPAWLEASTCALRYVCHLAGSVRQLVPRSFVERGGLVTNWGDTPANAVAEQALLLALAALRNLPAWPSVSSHAHETIRRVERLNTRSLFGRRVGIHGFGSVARALLRLLQPFGVDARVYSEAFCGTAVRSDGVPFAASLDALFARSEIVFECEALTPATAGSVSGRLLATLPDGGLFVNVARGEIVDEAALLLEVLRGRLRVALDVMTAESLLRRRDAFEAAGAVLSPHIAGPTLDHYGRCGDFAQQNLARFIRGEALEAVVTLERYDRST